MTVVYFVRHAEVTYIPDESLRALSALGIEQANQISDYFDGLKIDRFLSSPYKRAIETIEKLALSRGIKIEQNEALRERKVANGHIDDFNGFVKRQWENFDYKLEDGESLSETKERGLGALNEIVNQCENENVVIGTHGTILSVLLNHYDPLFGYENWKAMKMPSIYKLEFNDLDFTGYKLCL